MADEGMHMTLSVGGKINKKKEWKGGGRTEEAEE